MSDSGTDAFVGATAALFLAVAVFAAASGNPLTSSPSGASTAGQPTVSDPTRTPTARPTASSEPRPTTNIPGGTLPGCTGEVISNETVSTGGQAVNLKVYYLSGEGGRNCAVASKVGGTVRSRGPLTVTLRFADAETGDWPQVAEHRSSASATRSGSVYLDGTDNRCVRAGARFTPTDGEPVEVASGLTGCD